MREKTVMHFSVAPEYTYTKKVILSVTTNRLLEITAYMYFVDVTVDLGCTVMSGLFLE